nr:EOG090X0H1B [Lepidurus arcticus]
MPSDDHDVALELFVESLLKKSVQVTMARSAKTLSPAHLKQCVMAESRFDFLRELLASVPDIQGDGEDPRTHPLSIPANDVPPQRGRGRPRRTQGITPSVGRGNGRAVAPKRGVSTTTESEEEDDEDSDEGDEDDEGSSKDSAQMQQPFIPPTWNPFTSAGPSFQPLPVGIPVPGQAVALNFYQDTSASMTPATAQMQAAPSSFHTGANGLNLSMNKASASGRGVQGTEEDYDNY